VSGMHIAADAQGTAGGIHDAVAAVQEHWAQSSEVAGTALTSAAVACLS